MAEEVNRRCSLFQISQGTMLIPALHQADGTAEPCFSTRSLEKFKITPGDPRHSEMEEVIKNCAAVSYIGMDLTYFVLSVPIFNM